MSRPFTRDGETYRVCLRCGMHRAFDLQNWKTKGPYYRSSESPRLMTKNIDPMSEVAAANIRNVARINTYAAARRR
jgi:hypothetical protein